jgi:hypothetical protein
MLTKVSKFCLFIKSIVVSVDFFVSRAEQGE